jgi:hypothetical protein
MCGGGGSGVFGWGTIFTPSAKKQPRDSCVFTLSDSKFHWCGAVGIIIDGGSVDRIIPIKTIP